MEDEETKKKEIEKLLAGFIELKAEKEQEKTALNVLQIDIQWRDLMREAKSKELQEELHQMKQAFTKAVDYKDAVITALQTQLEQIEIQNTWTSCAHMKTLEELVALGHRRSENLLQLYEQDLSEFKKKYSEIREEIEKKYEKDCAWFNDLDFIEESIFQEEKKKIAKDYLLLNEAIEEEVEKEEDKAIEKFDCSIRETWRQFQAALVKYLEDAVAMEKMFTELKAEYKETIEDAGKDVEAYKELKESIPLLKAQIGERKKDHFQRITKTTTGQEGFYSNLNAVKAKILKIRKSDKAALTQLIANSSVTIRELQRLVSKGDKILRLHKRIKKLEEYCGETIRESLLTQEELEEAKANSKFQLPKEIQMDKNCKYLLQLEKFWERHNTVVLHNLALKKELYELELHSRKLQNEMSTFLQGVAEGKVQRSLEAKVNAVKPTVQEATLIAKNI